MRQNDIYRPRATDVALSGSSGSQRALHIGQLQVMLDAARKDPEVDNAVGFLEELATMCSVARGWLVTAHNDYAAADPGERPMPAQPPSVPSAVSSPSMLPAGPPAAEDLATAAGAAGPASGGQTSGSLRTPDGPAPVLEPRGYTSGAASGS